MAGLSIHFLFPGDLETPTGGYHYDRRLIEELRTVGVGVETVALPHCSAKPGEKFLKSARQALSRIPDQAVVVIDGLAFGVLHELAESESRRLRLVALCHHPLALETGLGEQEQQSLLHSERRALKCTRAVIVTSEHTRQILVDQFAVPAGKIAVALPGTERVAFAPCNGNPVRLLTVASLIRRKAHDVLINALAALHSLSWTARFVGGDDFDPAWASQLRELVEKQQLSRRIVFAGAADNVLPEYQQADVFVLPSRFEGYGMVFAEALAAGLPVIAARSGAVPSVVPETAGLLVAPDDTEALTAALHRLLTSDALRKRLQEGARQAAASLPAWQDSAGIVARKLIEIRDHDSLQY